MLTAITRKVSPNLASCQLEYLKREPIDVARAAVQHRDYEAWLERLGVRVVSLPTERDLPDCVFVEDPALVLDGVPMRTAQDNWPRWSSRMAIVSCRSTSPDACT